MTKTTLRSVLLFLVAAWPAFTSAKTYPAPILDTTGTFTFDGGITRIITNATFTVARGGGYIVATTDTGEIEKRYVLAGTPYTATFSKFTKLAKSVTFTTTDAAGKPIIFAFTVTNLIVKDRYPVTFAPLWKGVVSTTNPDTGVVTAKDESSELNGPTFSPAAGTPGGTQFVSGTGAGPITVQVALYDANGIYITTVEVTLPVI